MDIFKYSKSRTLLFLAVSAMVLFQSCVYEREETPLKIAFVRSSDIYTMNDDGTDVKQLTFTADNGQPSWSPDGKTIAFHSTRYDGTALNIYLIDSDGKNLRQMTYNSSSNYAKYPTWMPNGNLVYCRSISSVYTFVITDIKGNVLKTASGSSAPFDITVSPDSEYIAFSYGANAIGMVKISDDTTTVLTGSGSNQGSHWGKDIDKLYYFNGSVIYYVSYTEPLTVYTFCDLGTTITGFAFSADEKYIYYSSSGYIYKIDTETFSTTQLTSTGTDSAPCVQGRPI